MSQHNNVNDCYDDADNDDSGLDKLATRYSCSSVPVTLTDFSKHGQVDFYKAADSISDYIKLLECPIPPPPPLSVSQKIRVTSLLAVFHKHGHMDFSKTSNSISHHLTSIFPENCQICWVGRVGGLVWLGGLGGLGYLRRSRGLSARRARRTKSGPEGPPTRSRGPEGP